MRGYQILIVAPFGLALGVLFPSLDPVLLPPALEVLICLAYGSPFGAQPAINKGKGTSFFGDRCGAGHPPWAGLGEVTNCKRKV